MTEAGEAREALRQRLGAAAALRAAQIQDDFAVDGILCDGCYLQQPLAEFTLYGIWHLCLACAVEYEAGRGEGRYEDVAGFFATSPLPGELGGEGWL